MWLMSKNSNEVVLYSFVSFEEVRGLLRLHSNTVCFIFHSANRSVRSLDHVYQEI